MCNHGTISASVLDQEPFSIMVAKCIRAGSGAFLNHGTISASVLDQKEPFSIMVAKVHLCWIRNLSEWCN